LKIPNVSRMLTGVAVSALMIVVPLVLLLFGPGKQGAITVEVHDDAGVLQVASFEKSIEDIRFWQPTHVVILTLPDVPGRLLNDAVLDYARTEKTDVPWIEPSDNNFWADSVFILAVAPDDRLVGTYSGEDIKVDLETQADIQDATKDDFRAGNWAGGLVAGVNAASDVMGRSIFHHPVVKAVEIGLAVLGVLRIFVVISRRFRANTAVEQARMGYANVTRDFEGTQITAQTVPAAGKHGAAIINRFEKFSEDYHSLTQQFNDFGFPGWLDMFTSETLQNARSLRDQSRSLDLTDDSIVGAADFLNLRGDWRGVWTREQGPIFEDLAGLQKLLVKIDGKVPVPEQSRAKGLLDSVPSRLAVATTELEKHTRSPEKALDLLDELNIEIHAAANKLIERAMDISGSTQERSDRRKYWNQTNWSKQPGYSGRWSYHDYQGSYSPGSTIRPNSATLGGSGSASSMSVPIAGLIVGYSSATAQAAPSSSSSGGYSGGGGFSGSGSSSSF